MTVTDYASKHSENPVYSPHDLINFTITVCSYPAFIPHFADRAADLIKHNSSNNTPCYILHPRQVI